MSSTKKKKNALVWATIVAAIIMGGATIIAELISNKKSIPKNQKTYYVIVASPKKSEKVKAIQKADYLNSIGYSAEVYETSNSHFAVSILSTTIKTEADNVLKNALAKGDIPSDSWVASKDIGAKFYTGRSVEDTYYLVFSSCKTPLGLDNQYEYFSTINPSLSLEGYECNNGMFAVVDGPFPYQKAHQLKNRLKKEKKIDKGAYIIQSGLLRKIK